MIPNYSDNALTVTAAIIVKDEERCISRCLDSLLPVFDEIVILDTGSTDNTLNIIEQYQSEKIKLFHENWHNNFSKARNTAISKCTCQYILFIDADEYLSANPGQVRDELRKIKNTCVLNQSAFCPVIRDHNNNLSTTVRRGFENNGEFYYVGYVHEELRHRMNKEINDITIPIMIHHDGYKSDIIENKKKKKRNNILNLKNMHHEPDKLRWIFFYYRDDFENIDTNDIYCSLSTALKINKDRMLTIENIKQDRFTFGIVDLMAKAKLKSLDDAPSFHQAIQIMNHLVPGNSNSFYYDLIYDIFTWKNKVKERVNDIIKYKNSKYQNHDGMIHSDGLHIDAALSLYLYEVGLITQSQKLLISVEQNGFSSELSKLYLRNIKLINSEADNEH